MTTTFDDIKRENARLKKQVQILYKRQTRVPDEMSKCQCGNADPRSSTASKTGMVCYSCGGEA